MSNIGYWLFRICDLFNVAWLVAVLMATVSPGTVSTDIIFSGTVSTGL